MAARRTALPRPSPAASATRPSRAISASAPIESSSASGSRVAPGGCPPGAPTDPDMQISRVLPASEREVGGGSVVPSGPSGAGAAHAEEEATGTETVAPAPLKHPPSARPSSAHFDAGLDHVAQVRADVAGGPRLLGPVNPRQRRSGWARPR